jgi:hypothetical protein
MLTYADVCVAVAAACVPPPEMLVSRKVEKQVKRRHACGCKGATRECASGCCSMCQYLYLHTSNASKVSSKLRTYEGDARMQVSVFVL